MVNYKIMKKNKVDYVYWTLDKIDILKSQWGKVSISTLSRDLGISYGRIRAMVKMLKDMGKDLGEPARSSSVKSLVEQSIRNEKV